MLSVPKITSPPMVDHKKYNSMSSASSVKKGGALDFWSENIHFAHFHEEPDTAPRLAANQRLVSETDKFVEYIRHVESKFPLLDLC